VYLRFSRYFHDHIHASGRQFNVRFAIKRIGFVFMHEALDVAQRGLVAGARPELLLPPPDETAVPDTGVQVRMGSIRVGLRLDDAAIGWEYRIERS
jgi:hypothetical protein